MAQKYGFQIRYFMIAGNRSESLDSIQQSLDFIEKARPNSYIFTPFFFTLELKRILFSKLSLIVLH